MSLFYFYGASGSYTVHRLDNGERYICNIMRLPDDNTYYNGARWLMYNVDDDDGTQTVFETTKALIYALSILAEVDF